MSLERYNHNDLRNVCITGQKGKSVVFQAAARFFLQEDQLRHGNVDSFYYIPEDSPFQIYLRDLEDFDGPHGDYVTTPYRDADCIILVYDPTIQNSLDKVCKHYNKMIRGETNAAVLLLRNLSNPHQDPILISPQDEADILSTTGGNSLGRELHSVNTGRRFVYDVLSHVDATASIEAFFKHELIEFLLQMEIPRAVEERERIEKSCLCSCFYYLCCCCFCKDTEEDDEVTLVENA